MVFDLLCKKAIHERRRQDANNKTNLGGVNFFFNIDENEKQTYLCWDVKPDEWDESKIIEDMRNYEAYMEAEKRGELSPSPFHF